MNQTTRLLFTSFDDYSINEYISKQILDDKTFIFFDYNTYKHTDKKIYPPELIESIQDFEQSPLYVGNSILYYPVFISKSTYMMLILSDLIQNEPPLDLKNTFKGYASSSGRDYYSWLYNLILSDVVPRKNSYVLKIK